MQIINNVVLTVSDFQSTVNGGAVSLNASRLEVQPAGDSRVVFQNNRVTTTVNEVGGGVIASLNNSTVIMGNNILFDNNSIVNTTTTNQVKAGGSIYNNGSNFTLGDDVRFTNNAADSSSFIVAGGAVENISSGTFTIGDRANFSGNSARGGVAAAALGGAIDSRDASVTIGDDAVFQGNQSTSTNASGGGSGGAIFFAGNTAISRTMSIGRNALFSQNTASGAPATGKAGGAIQQLRGTVIVGDGAVFVDNEVTGAGQGGAVTSQLGQLTLGSNTEFRTNKAALGGGISNFGSSITIGSGSRFIENSATVGGGISTIEAGLIFLIDENSTTLFSGNIDATGSNAIAFDAGTSTFATATGSSGRAEDGLLDMRDSMSASSAAFGIVPEQITLDKNDNGVWALGGANNFSVANRTNFNINAGSLYLYAQDEVANATTGDLNARVVAGGLNLGGTDTVTTSALVVGSSGALVAGGTNNVDLGTGTITLEDGATLRGGSASQSLGGNVPNRHEQGGSTRLTLSSDSNTQLNGLLNMAALDQDDTFTLNAVLADGSASGSVVKSGAGTVVLPSDSTYSGATTINAGTLQVNGSLVSAVSVFSNGRLSGTGSVGSTVVNGAIAPGNSIGTITINGNYVQNPGSVYQVEINPNGSSDLINVIGTATINGGDVAVIKEPGTYIIPSRYTILTASASVSGNYDGITQSMPFLNFLLAYDANNVYLDIARSPLGFAALASTPDEVATANAVESLGMNNPVYDAVANLSNATQAAQAFNALSGEAHASVLSAFTEDSRYVRSATLNRLDNALMNTGLPASGKKSGLWAHAYGAWGNIEGNSNTAEVSRSNKGFVIGADKRFDQNVAGILGGYSHSRIDVNKRASKAQSDDYSLGIYTGRTMESWSAKVGAVYTFHQLDMNRNVSFTGFLNNLKTDYSGSTAQVFAEMDYDMKLARMMLKPFAGAAYVYSDTGSWKERGGSAALRGNNDFDIFYTSFGVKQSMSLSVKPESQAISESITLAWRHAFGSTVPTSRFAFVSGGTPFNIQGAPIAEDSLLLDAGLNLAVTPKNLNLRVAYIAQFANKLQDNGVTGNVTWMFD